jgi:uroporphyrinogen-III synthase
LIYILSEKKYDGADNLPVIKFNYIDQKIDFASYDALIFTSKNGILAIKEKFDLWRDVPTFCIGSATASEVQKLGGIVAYRAKNSYGDSFAHEITSLLQGKRALFLRAKMVTSSLNEILRDCGVVLDEMVVYETVCTPSSELFTPKPNSIIIFSSPSTIECFFKSFEWDSSYKAVVIGEVTANHMPKELSFEMASEPNIPSCIALAQTMI